VSKRIAGKRWPPVPPPREMDELAGRQTSTLSEADLMRGYSMAHEPAERPVTPVYDESGLLYGEPVSDGRTAERRIP
jgi:hypothetical protein